MIYIGKSYVNVNKLSKEDREDFLNHLKKLKAHTVKYLLINSFQLLVIMKLSHYLRVRKC
jgi:hypothetical protein